MSTQALTPDPNPSPNPEPPPKHRRQVRRTLADTLLDWESLLAAVADNGADLAVVEPYRAALAATLERGRTIKATQQSQDAGRQGSTETLRDVIQEGKEQAISLRGAVRAALGPTAKKLVQFNIRPLTRRPRADKSSNPAPAPETAAGATASGKEGSEGNGK
ncbi:MAG TPA: hypothetical protein VMM92_14750 [Thermoanaerobaculia bacterium]|nr:hypothetical protein [Thermoanaerobaculia bacterium]